MIENQSSIDVISEKLIFLDCDYQDQTQVLEYLSEQAAINGYVQSQEEFLQAVLARENEVSTAIGYLIAIPHGKTDVVNQPFIAFMRMRYPISWGEYSEKVKLVFLIGVPESSSGKLHLKFISQLSKNLLNSEFRKQLLELENINTVYQQLTISS